MRRLTCAMIVAFSCTLLHAAEPASDADKVFVGNVSQGGAYEVAASKVAMMRATMPDVKDLATSEVHDHESVGANLKRISASVGIPIAAQLNPEFTQRLAKLKAVSAADFDAAYIADMKQIHDKDEKLFAKEANEGSSNFQTFAHQTDLIVKRHIGALNGY
jgi:putative membrane protein